MRAKDLVDSVYFDLSQGETKLKTLGRTKQNEGRLALDTPESLARYTDILRPSIVTALHANRAKGRVIMGCILVLFAVACYLAVFGNAHDLRLITATSIPGLGVAAWWPIAALMRFAGKINASDDAGFASIIAS